MISPADAASFTIPDDWFEKYYPNASASERQAIAEGAGGKTDASGAAWSEVGAGDEGDFRFFRVTVEMP